MVHFKYGTLITYNASSFAGFTSSIPLFSLTVDGLDVPSYNWPQVHCIGVKSLRAVAQIILTRVLSLIYKHGKDNK